MTQGQYERAELIARKLRNMNYALDAMKSQEDVTLTIKDRIANRIAELEKEFEEL